MKTTFLLALLSLPVLSMVTSCEKEGRAQCGFDDQTEPALIAEERSGEVTCTGVIQQQGITTYQYGSHTIDCGYALTSETINLDDYVGQTVTITGSLIADYPVEDGPEYVEVTQVIE